MTKDLLPGQFVRHPEMPEWGLGQIQSVTERFTTVNFENAGKVTIDHSVVSLIPVNGEHPA